MKSKEVMAIFLSILQVLCSCVVGSNVVNADTVGNTEKTVFITEICAKNTEYQTSNGNYYDWIELYNSGDEAVDLAGYGLTDKKKTPYKYIFPSDSIILPNSYLVVFCDKDASVTDDTVAGFGLSNEGETIMLSMPKNENSDGEIIDKVTYENLGVNESYGLVDNEWHYFDEISPEEENREGLIRVEAPIFSHQSGFYEDEFELSLIAEDGLEVYYTLDGSAPNRSGGGQKYVESILISDCSIKLNKLSNYTNISTLQTNPPDEMVDKATIIRAVAYNENGKASKIINGTFFVNFGEKAEYYQKVKTVSIMVEEDDFFGDERGIYVLGNVYNDWLNNKDVDHTINQVLAPANYQQQGKEWEREVYIQIFEQNEMMFNENGGIRIHGQGSRAVQQKGFNIYARSEYGTSKFTCDLFSGNNLSVDGKIIDEYDSFVLRNAGSDWKGPRFRDSLNQALVSDRDVFTQQTEPCIVFVNGEYWGHYDMMERIEKETIASTYDVNANDVCIIKIWELIEGTQAGQEQWNEFYHTVMNSDLSEEKSYQKLEGEVDVQSLIDYMSANIYYANIDWGLNNFAWWRTENIDSSIMYADGKWRFIIFDTDLTDGFYDHINNNNYNMFDHIEQYESPSQLFDIFKQFMKNPEFAERFYSSFMDIANYNFDNEKVQKKIDELASEYEAYSLDYYKRFESGTTWTAEDYQASVDVVRDFFKDRFFYATNHLKDYMGLDGDLVSVTINNDTEHGKVRLNTLNLDSESSWTGKYYTDYPIKLSAEPKAGYELQCWELSDGRILEDEDVEVTLVGDVTITPVYQPQDELWGTPYRVDDGGRKVYDASVKHVMIESAYGAGPANSKGNRKGYLSNDYIELYNPTDGKVDLNGWSVLYRSSEDGEENGGWVRHGLSGKIPAKSSYLIACAKINKPDDETKELIKISGDDEWNQKLHNKGMSILLLNNQDGVESDALIFDNRNKCPNIEGYVDMYSVSGNDGIDKQKAVASETEASAIQSKKKTVRRVGVSDTDDNSVSGDFEEVDFSSDNEAYVAYILPKNTAYGAWLPRRDKSDAYTIRYEVGMEQDAVVSSYPFYIRPTAVDAPDVEGYEFKGWYQDGDLTKPYEFSGYLIEDITVYAKYEKIDGQEDEGDDNGGSESGGETGGETDPGSDPGSGEITDSGNDPGASGETDSGNDSDSGGETDPGNALESGGGTDSGNASESEGETDTGSNSNSDGNSGAGDSSNSGETSGSADGSSSGSSSGGSSNFGGGSSSGSSSSSSGGSSSGSSSSSSGSSGSGGAAGVVAPVTTRTKDGTVVHKNSTGAYVDNDGNVIVNTLLLDSTGTMHVTDGEGYPVKEQLAVTESGETYVVGFDGNVVVSAIAVIAGKKYIADANGEIAKNKFTVLDGGKIVYSNEKGEVAIGTFFNVDGKKYYSTQNGFVATDKIVKVDGRKYYAKKSGAIAVKKIVKYKGKKYYASRDGSFVKNKWVKVGKKKYYCNKNGVITKGKNRQVMKKL